MIATSLRVFSFDAPAISLVYPSNGALGRRSVLSISGLSFGSVPSVSVSLGISACTLMHFTSETSITCTPHLGVGAGLVSTVTVADFIGTSNAQFSFDAPVLSSLFGTRSVTNGPSSIGQMRLVLAGINFGQGRDCTPSVAAASGGLCMSTGWSSNTKIECSQVRLVQSSGLSLTVLVGSMQGTSSLLLTFDAPVASMYQHQNLAMTAGSLISSIGLNFGVLDLTQSMRLSSHGCMSTSWTSLTTVTCSYAGLPALPTATVLPVTTVLSVSTVAGTCHNALTFDAPVVSGLVPENSAGSARIFITASGFNFIQSDPTPYGHISSSACATTSWSSATSLLCRLHGHAETLWRISAVTLTVAQLVSTAAALLSFDAPTLSYALAVTNLCLSGGQTLSLCGINFAADATLSSADSAHTLSLTASWSTATSVTVSSPVGLLRSSGDGSFVPSITVASGVGTLGSALSFDAAVVSTLAPSNTALTGGAWLTILGLSFATADPTPTVGAGAYACTTTSWVSTTSARCLAASAVRSSYVQFVAVLTGTAFQLLSYDAAIISFASPSNVASSGHSQVALSGLSFGQANCTVAAELGRVGSLTVSWTSATSLLLTPAYSDLIRSSAVVTLSALISSSYRLVSFDAPVVSNAPLNIHPGIEVPLTLVGLNFGERDLTPSSVLSGLLCKTTAWTATSSVICISSVAEPSAGQVDLQMYVAADSNRGIYTRSAMWTFDAPVLSWHAAWNGPTLGGPWVTVFGLHFGPAMRVSIGHSACLTASWTSLSSARCSVGVGTGADRVVSGSLVASSVGTSTAYFSYAPPVITAITPNTGESIGGTVVYLSGGSLGIDAQEVQISVGNTQCMSVRVTAPDKQLSCTTTAGSGDALAVTAIINGQVDLPRLPLTVHALLV
jgi:hypothetical protein